MTETRSRFDLKIKLREDYDLATKFVLSTIPLIRKEGIARKRIEEINSQINNKEDEINSLLSVREMLEDDTKKVIQNIITTKSNEVEELKKEGKQLQEIYAEFTSEIQEIQQYIRGILKYFSAFDCNLYSFGFDDNEELLGYLIMESNFGENRVSILELPIIPGNPERSSLITASGNGWEALVEWIIRNK